MSSTIKNVRRTGQASTGDADERGFAVIMTALLLIPLMAFTGFAVDIGSWYARGSSLQKAADAAALAGVVWMPDIDMARSVALDVAAQNGMVDGVDDITVVVSTTPASNQIEVKITDAEVDMYFASLFLDNVDIDRAAIAEYVTEVPLGSPKNFFGTGKMISGSDRENFAAAINGFCTPREQGDHRSVRFEGNWHLPGYLSDIVCPTPVGPGPNVGNSGNTLASLNSYFVPGASYEYYIDVPPGAGTTELMLFDPAYHADGGTQQSYDRSSSSSRVTTTFSVYAPDTTPFDDSDNAPYDCGSGTAGFDGSKTFTTNATDYTETLSDTSLISARWEDFCTLASGTRPLRYILRVDTRDGEAGSTASNNYAILADPAGSTVLCDTRTSSACPAVVAKEWMSIDAEEKFGSGSCRSSNPTTTRTAKFFLAKIGDEHEGKTMQIELFDPGEGSSYIQILDPVGNVVNFDWYDKEAPSVGANSVNHIRVDGTVVPGPGRASRSRYSDRFLRISVPLPNDFSSYGSERWWKVSYTATVPNGCSVSDRTSWSVLILGDPVRLIE